VPDLCCKLCLHYKSLPTRVAQPLASLSFVRHEPSTALERSDSSTSNYSRTATNPEYSAIRDIKFEAHLQILSSAYTFKKVLQQVNNLETFTLSLIKADKNKCRCDLCRLSRLDIRDWLEVDTERFQVDTILSGIKSNCLSELVFANTILSYKTLKGLLERHRGTIRKLSIRGCELTGGTWIDLLQWISHNLPSLEHLVLQNLQELRWRRTFNKYDHSDMMWGTLFSITERKNLDTYIATLTDGNTSG
jgi:hypothetical protein